MSAKIKRKKRKCGTLVIIGGAEDKKEARIILNEVVRRHRGGKMVIVTAASEIPEFVWEDYKKVFFDLGIKKIEHLHVKQAEDARDPSLLSLLDGARSVFFSGGDQLKITTKLGGTKIIDRIFEIFKNGGTIAGTSAGASIMGKTMLVGGENRESHKVGNWMMAPGLGFIEDMIIDQHFAQRGRIGRLIGAVGLNPGVLGIGIDEDTAIVVEEDNDEFTVIGKNAVYVVDGRDITYTNVSEAAADETMSMHDMKLHILAHNETFNLTSRKAYAPSQRSP